MTTTTTAARRRDSGAARARSARDRRHRERAWETKSKGRASTRKARRRLRAVGGLLVALALAGGVLAVLLYRDMAAVRTDLTAARSGLQAAAGDAAVLGTGEGRAAAATYLDGASRSIAAARARADRSLALRALGAVPVLRGQASGVHRVIDDSARATALGRDLLAGFDRVATGTRLRDGVMPLDGLRAFQRELAATATSLHSLRRDDGLWGRLGDGRRRFDAVAASTADRLAGAADALDAALPFVGEAGDRRYLVALQNNAEMRDSGMVLSYAVIRFESGRLTFERNGPIGDLALAGPAPTAIPDGTRDVFGPLAPTTLWHSVNATADFGWSGQAMQQMFRQATGEGVDGVIGIDVVGLARLLGVVGPVDVAGLPEPVGAENAARVLLHDLYEGLPPSSDQGARRERLGDVTRAVTARLTAGEHDPVQLGRELGTAAAGGHLRLWSPAAHEQDVFARTGLGGGPASVAPERTFHVAVENRTASKLDYYVTSSVRQAIEVTASGDAIVRTTVVVENTAPAGAAPSYQLGPDRFTAKPGDYLAWVLLWAPSGSEMGGTRVVESGLPLAQVVVPVAAGERKEVEFPPVVVHHAVHDGRLQLRFVPQPRLVPPNLEVTLTTPGRNVSEPSRFTGLWDRVFNTNWQIRP